MTIHNSAMKTSLRRLRGLGSEGDLVAEPLQATHEIARGSALLDAVQVGGTEIPVRQSRGQHVVRGDEDLVADGHGGALGPAAGPESVELVAEVPAFLVRRRHGRLPQRRPEVHVALPGASPLVFARALIVVGTDAGPRARMLGA